MNDPKTLNKIAARIKERRLELGLSLQEVSDTAEISKSTLQRYETGSIQNIPLQKLDSLSRALKTSSEWLLGLRENADERTSIDVDLKKILDYLGYRIKSWPYTGSRIYISCDAGSGAITEEEYKQFRDNTIAFITFNIKNLANMAIERENNRLEDENRKLEIYFSSGSPTDNEPSEN